MIKQTAIAQILYILVGTMYDFKNRNIWEPVTRRLYFRNHLDLFLLFLLLGAVPHILKQSKTKQK